jgi:hypothetical protein
VRARPYGLSGRDLARRIERLTRLVRESQASGPQAAELFQPAPGPAPRPADKPHRQPDRKADGQQGWWVLAQGAELDPEDFASREAVREALLAAVRQSGVLVGENVWVWDETGRAQLVLATLPTQERAERVAVRLREKGLSVVVRREMP